MKKKIKKMLSYFLALAVVLGALAAIPPGASAAVNRTDRPALQDVYRDYFLIGNVFGGSGGGTGQVGQLTNVTPGDNSETALRRKHFNAMTPGNFSKPDTIWPSSTQGGLANQPNANPNFSGADPLLREGNQLGYYTIGHALVWHNQSNGWPAGNYSGTFPNIPANNSWDYEQARSQLERYIQTVLEHFEDDVKFDAWDVVNEVMKDNPVNPTDWRNALRTGWNPEERSSRWSLAYSRGGDPWEHIYDAFVFTRKYSDTKTIFNDFNDLENDAKATAIASLVRELNERYAAEQPNGPDPRKLIEVIGIQAHYDTRLNLDALERNIRKYLDLGVEVHITELDVSLNIATDKWVSTTNTGIISNTTNRAEIEELFVEQAIFYAKLFSLLKEYADYKAGIPRVSWFTIYDQNGWRSMSRPMLWENRASENANPGSTLNMQPKEAYWAVVQPEAYLAEAGMTPGGPATFAYGGNSYSARTWGGAHSFVEIDVSVPAGTSAIEFTDANVTLPAGFSLADIKFSRDGGAVSGGRPLVVTVNAVSAANPNNTATYKLRFAWDMDATRTDYAWRLATSIESGQTYIIVSAETDMALTNKSKGAVTGTNAAPASLSRTPVIVSEDGATLLFDEPEQENLKFIFEERPSPSAGAYEDQAGHTIQCLVHATAAYPGIVFRRQVHTNGQYGLVTRQRDGSEGPLIADKVLDQAVWFNTDIDPVTGETQMFLYSGDDSVSGTTEKYFVLKEVETGNSTADRFSIAPQVGGFVALASDNPTEDATVVRLYEYVIAPYEFVPEGEQEGSQQEGQSEGQEGEGQSREFNSGGGCEAGFGIFALLLAGAAALLKKKR